MNLPTERDLCSRCLRSKWVCYCPQIRPFSTSFQLIILQHPRERKRSIGTGRIAHLCVENSVLIVGKFFAGNAEVERLIRDPENQCVILYPGSESTLLEGGKPIEKPGRRLVIFLIDGTWTTAKNMLRLSPNLQALPQIRLNPVRKSQYRIRRQPQSVCLSTVEATHQLIEAVDGPGECENLLHVFRYMVDEQLKWSTPRWNLEPDLALKPVSAVVPESVGQECTK